MARHLKPNFRLYPSHAHERDTMLRQRAEQRWGDDPDYRAYLKRTRLLLTLPKGTLQT